MKEAYLIGTDFLLSQSMRKGGVNMWGTTRGSTRGDAAASCRAFFVAMCNKARGVSFGHVIFVFDVLIDWCFAVE